MDQPVLVYAITAVAVTVPCFYLALVFLSPPPIVTRPSEKKYRSRSSPNTPKPLPSLADKGSVDLTVVIPAYNETARLPSMLSTTLAHLSTPALKKSRTYEILIVDDGSADETSALGVKLAGEYPESDIRVVTLEKNLGKGGAVRHGMLYARGQRLLMVDADGASRFEDLELLWEAMDKLAPKNEPAVVVGSRAHLVKTEAVVKRSFIRNILMYGLHTILRIVGVGHIRDTQCGFKLFTRRAAQ
ncbi:glycosyltransferase family 2 protein, partial [Serpula lacrymans var. lacrymans S7.3]